MSVRGCGFKASLFGLNEIYNCVIRIKIIRTWCISLGPVPSLVVHHILGELAYRVLAIYDHYVVAVGKIQFYRVESCGGDSEYILKTTQQDSVIESIKQRAHIEHEQHCDTAIIKRLDDISLYVQKYHLGRMRYEIYSKLTEAPCEDHHPVSGVQYVCPQDSLTP